MMQDAPIVPLYYDEVYRFVKPGITGMEPDALNMLNLKQVKKLLNIKSVFHQILYDVIFLYQLENSNPFLVIHPNVSIKTLIIFCIEREIL